MGGLTYEYIHPLPLCEKSSEIFEVFGIPMRERNKPRPCPHCEIPCKRIISRVNFNEIFPGSTKRETLADHWTKESIKAQAEGFRSKDELDTAIGLAKERAKEMGQPDKQLIGPVESPFKGEKYQPSKSESETADSLVRETIKASHTGNPDRIVEASQDLSTYEKSIKEKATKQLKFEPKHDKNQLQKQIKQSQEARKA